MAEGLQADEISPKATYKLKATYRANACAEIEPVDNLSNDDKAALLI